MGRHAKRDPGCCCLLVQDLSCTGYVLWGTTSRGLCAAGGCGYPTQAQAQVLPRGQELASAAGGQRAPAGRVDQGSATRARGGAGCPAERRLTLASDSHTH